MANKMSAEEKVFLERRIKIMKDQTGYLLLFNFNHLALLIGGIKGGCCISCCHFCGDGNFCVL